MNHDFIATHDVIARYVAERLAIEDEQAFEAHLVDCARCSAEVEQELALRAGLGAAAAERATVSRPAAPLKQPPPQGWWTRGVWLSAAAAVVVIVGLGLVLSLARTTAALRAAISERAEQQRRADDAARTAQGLERRIADLEALAAKRPLEPDSAPRASTDPVVPATVFALTAVRGGDASAAETFTFDRAQVAQVVLTVDIPPGEYRVRLKDRAGRDVWSGGRFRPSAQDVMAIAVERRVLTDGQYTLEIHRDDADGQAPPVARYRFQISSR